MKIIKILMLVITLIPLTSYAQNSDQMQNQLEEFMKHRDEILRSVLGDDFDQNIEEKMQRMMESFSGGWPDLNDQGFGNSFANRDWETTETHKILRLKVKQIKDRPLDIKIEKGMIHIKGDAELEFGKTKNIVKFERSYSIPQDVDQTSPEFENNADEIIIKFKLLNVAKAKTIKSPLNKIVAPKKRDPKLDRVPIGPSDDGLSL